MKRYKLIKEYPGSPDLGWISNNNWKGYPEFWEEVTEKDYEILLLKNKRGTIIDFTNVIKPFTVEELYNNQFQLNSKYSSDEFIIHSVKRLSSL